MNYHKHNKRALLRQTDRTHTHTHIPLAHQSSAFSADVGLTFHGVLESVMLHMVTRAQVITGQLLT